MEPLSSNSIGYGNENNYSHAQLSIKRRRGIAIGNLELLVNELESKVQMQINAL